MPKEAQLFISRLALGPLNTSLIYFYKCVDAANIGLFNLNQYLLTFIFVAETLTAKKKNLAQV